MEESLRPPAYRAGDSNRLTRLANLFEHAEAFGFELGNGYFFYVLVIPWSMTMVNLLSQDAKIVFMNEAETETVDAIDLPPIFSPGIMRLSPVSVRPACLSQ